MSNIRKLFADYQLSIALLLSLGGGAATGVFARSEPAPEEITYLANVENGTSANVKYTGREWAVNEGGFLSGKGTGHQILMMPPPAAGDFRVHAEFDLPARGKKSALTIGYDSRIILTAGTDEVILQGRFFRAGEKPITVKGSTNGPVEIERKGAVVEVRMGGKTVYSGPCDTDELAMLGMDPMEGIVQLRSMSAAGTFPKERFKEFGNPFGMQMRKSPASAKEVFAPVIVAPGPTNECSMVARRDGTLELYHATKPASDSISVMRSEDGGISWGASEIALPLPGKIYYALMATEGRDGVVHLVFHLAGQGPGGYRGRLYNVHYTRTTKDGKGWETPKLVIPGYVGSIRALIELASGRLVLSVGLANPDRMEAPASGIDYGWNDVVTYYSDDSGGNWKASEDVLKIPLPGENATRYGAIEPALVQLNDGRIWMLIRSRDGRFWESFSNDGAKWSQPERTAFITSDSPACFVKLKDNRIVLLANACQNWSNPKSYAMGGREVLQASISADDAKTWQGFRDVLHETQGPAGGDRGTAYASGVETKDGKVCFFGGQGEGKRAVVLFDPNWLVQTEASDNLAAGPVDWVQYGDDKLSVEGQPGGRQTVTLPLKSSGLCGAAWNFPAMKTGEVAFRIWMPSEAKALRLSLSDHFSRMDDVQAAENSIFQIPLEGGASLPVEKWSEVKLRWTPGEAELLVDGKSVKTIPVTKPSAFGVNYLRFEIRSDADQGTVKIAGLSAVQK